MKKQKTIVKHSKNKKDTSQNSFLNIIIILLSVLVLYFSYSLAESINSIFFADDENPETQLQSKVIQVEVLNGCGVSGLADKFTDFLREKKFDVVNIGNYRSFDIDNSIVIDRTGNIEYANLVADILGIEHKQVIQQINDDYFLDVTLIVGKDFNQLKIN